MPGDSGVDGSSADAIELAGTEVVPQNQGGDESPWTELVTPAIDLRGGAATTAGRGGAGGSLALVADGWITVDPALPPMMTPQSLEIPAGGIAVANGDLGADVSWTGTVRLSGVLQSSGTEPVRSIVARGGDIVLDGALRAADLGDRTQGIALSAPSGTVYLTGSLDTRGSFDRAGGAITITAQRVVVVGRLLSYGGARGKGGGDGGAIVLRATAGPVLILEGAIDSTGANGTGRAGNGGDLTIDAAGAIQVHGEVALMGGDARHSVAARGGNGGTLRATAAGDVLLRRRIRLRGGAALGAGELSGGNGGALRINGGGQVRLEGIFDGRGGLVSSTDAGGAARAGRAGDLIIGDPLEVQAIAISVPIDLSGGEGAAFGGAGGAVSLDADNGDVRLAGQIAFRGGASRAQAGNAGAFTALAGTDSAGFYLSGEIAGEGGAGLGAGPARGGAGAAVQVRLALAGPFVVEPTGRFIVDGGAATGAARAGSGGDLDIRTRDGDASMGGEILSRGGAAMGPGGTGGVGGAINLWTDTDADGIGGHLTIEPTGVIDVSGGNGSVGGSARNNGGHGVALFPINQHQISVLLNSETVPGPPEDGSLANLGVVIAKGGSPDGWGGDVMFHGRRRDGRENPLPGMQMLEGNGTGPDGDFAAE